MKYALLVYTDPDSMNGISDAEQAEISSQYYAVRDVPGVVDGAHLQPIGTATTVRVSNGEALVTDGPFADTKEVFGGFYLLEADDLDRAIEIAAKVPATWLGGSVEIRPLVEMDS